MSRNEEMSRSFVSRQRALHARVYARNVLARYDAALAVSIFHDGAVFGNDPRDSKTWFILVARPRQCVNTMAVAILRIHRSCVPKTSLFFNISIDASLSLWLGSHAEISRPSIPRLI